MIKPRTSKALPLKALTNLTMETGRTSSILIKRKTTDLVLAKDTLKEVIEDITVVITSSLNR